MNKKDLDFFREELLKERAKLLEGSSKVMNNDLKVQQEDLSDSMDRSSIEADRNFLLRLRDRERKLVKKIDDALNRIEQGTFGICEKCGDYIDEKRLKVRPVATLCISCKEEQEEKENLLGT